MSSMNKVVLIGHLGAAPEMLRSKSGEVFTKFRMATNDAWSDKAGQKQTRTEWHRVVVFGKQGEACGNYLKKGGMVCVEGRLQSQQWDDKASGDKRSRTEIIAERVRFLSKSEGGGSAHPGAIEEELEPSELPF